MTIRVQNGLTTSSNFCSQVLRVASRTVPLWFFCNCRSKICVLRTVLSEATSSARQVPGEDELLFFLIRADQLAGLDDQGGRSA